MIKNKEWYKSKTVWSALISLILAILMAMGFADNSLIIELIIAIASVLGIYGRATAKEQIKGIN